MQSALYEGRVQHGRHGPRPHRFGYRLFLFYLDLDELPERPWIFGRAWPLRFRRSDYLGPSDRPLRSAVLDRVEDELGRRPRGSVRLLTHVRTWGYVFNPVSFYYCHDEDSALDAIVAEITNTPWGERHAYVLDARTARRDGEELVWRFDKEFHVSPFFDMEQTYEWRFSQPGDRLAVHVTNYEDGRAVFGAGLACRRRELGAGALASALLRHPLLTLRVHAAIYWQAARLWLKRTPFFAHPRKRVTTTTS